MANTNSNASNLKINGKPEDKEYLYAVLNLPITATPADIRERHRQLSVIFHPDKQRDDESRASATKSFYEIQRAYEVLSDPFLREVYDTLGEDGLKVKYPSTLRELPSEQLHKTLKEIQDELERSEIENKLQKTGRVTCAIDATSLFDEDVKDAYFESQWYLMFWKRIQNINIRSYNMQNTVKKQIGPSTQLVFKGVLSQGFIPNLDDDDSPRQKESPPRMLNGSLLGLIRHQFTPQIITEATMNFLHPRNSPLQLASSYSTEENSIMTTLQILPNIRANFPFPPLSIGLSRKLFRDSPTQGTIAFNMVPGLSFPTIALGIRKPIFIHAKDKSSTSQDDAIVTGWAWNLNLSGVLPGPSISVEMSCLVMALPLRLKAGIEASLMGIATYVTGDWSTEDEKTGLGATVLLSNSGISLRLRLTHIGQTIVLPIALSAEQNFKVALAAAVLPSVAFVIGNEYILKPQRRLKRKRRKQAARRDADEVISQRKREAEQYISLLKDVAKRHTKTEQEHDGLVIVEAFYLPMDDDEKEGDALDLSVDVTIAVQALVHNGQLIIPGNRSKSRIQGFYDPLPDFPKRLRIRYEFRGRMHYVEVGEFQPVVLPMEDHLVDYK